MIAGHGRRGHAGKPSLLGRLYEHAATALIDLDRPCDPVVPGAGEHDRDRARPVRRCRAAEEDVDRRAEALIGRSAHGEHLVILDHQMAVGRRDVHAPRKKVLPVVHALGRQRPGSREDLGEPALEARSQVEDDANGGIEVGGQIGCERGHRLDASRRSTHDHDGLRRLLHRCLVSCGEVPETGYVPRMEATPRRLYFGAHADAYERARPEWPHEAARWLVPGGASFVVELGAGTGKLTRAVAGLGVRVLAVEPDPRMLAVLREGGLDGVEGSAEEIPLGDGEADAVVAGSCLHWFELDRALPEIHRVLRPGGSFGFGWNHRDTRDAVVGWMSEAIYSAQGRADRPHWRSRDWPGELTESGLFRDVEHTQFEHVHELPREGLDDHLMSYSGLAMLPDGERERVFAEVREILDADPSVAEGDSLRLPFVVDVFRAARV